MKRCLTYFIFGLLITIPSLVLAKENIPSATSTIHNCSTLNNSSRIQYSLYLPYELNTPIDLNIAKGVVQAVIEEVKSGKKITKSDFLTKLGWKLDIDFFFQCRKGDALSKIFYAYTPIPCNKLDEEKTFYLCPKLCDDKNKENCFTSIHEAQKHVILGKCANLIRKDFLQMGGAYTDRADEIFNSYISAITKPGQKKSDTQLLLEFVKCINEEQQKLIQGKGVALLIKCPPGYPSHFKCPYEQGKCEASPVMSRNNADSLIGSAVEAIRRVLVRETKTQSLNLQKLAANNKEDICKAVAKNPVYNDYACTKVDFCKVNVTPTNPAKPSSPTPTVPPVANQVGGTPAGSADAPHTPQGTQISLGTTGIEQPEQEQTSAQNPKQDPNSPSSILEHLGITRTTQVPSAPTAPGGTAVSQPTSEAYSQLKEAGIIKEQPAQNQTNPSVNTESRSNIDTTNPRFSLSKFFGKDDDLKYSANDNKSANNNSYTQTNRNQTGYNNPSSFLSPLLDFFNKQDQKQTLEQELMQTYGKYAVLQAKKDNTFDELFVKEIERDFEKRFIEAELNPNNSSTSTTTTDPELKKELEKLKKELEEIKKQNQQKQKSIADVELQNGKLSVKTDEKENLKEIDPASQEDAQQWLQEFLSKSVINKDRIKAIISNSGSYAYLQDEKTGDVRVVVNNQGKPREILKIKVDKKTNKKLIGLVKEDGETVFLPVGGILANPEEWVEATEAFIEIAGVEPTIPVRGPKPEKRPDQQNQTHGALVSGFDIAVAHIFGKKALSEGIEFDEDNPFMLKGTDGIRIPLYVYEKARQRYEEKIGVKALEQEIKKLTNNKFELVSASKALVLMPSAPKEVIKRIRIAPPEVKKSWLAFLKDELKKKGINKDEQIKAAIFYRYNQLAKRVDGVAVFAVKITPEGEKQYKWSFALQDFIRSFVAEAAGNSNGGILNALKNLFKPQDKIETNVEKIDSNQQQNQNIIAQALKNILSKFFGLFEKLF